MSQQSFNSSQEPPSTRKPSLSHPNLLAQRLKNQTRQSAGSIMGSPISESLHQFQSNSRMGLISAMRSSKRGSEISSTNDNYPYFVPSVKYENTYKLGPDDHQKFNPTKIKNIVYDVLETNLENFKYDPSKSKEIVASVSDDIKSKVKPIIYKRYKIIVNLTIGQNLGQNMTMVSRSLWNSETDNFCTVEYKNKTLFAIATIFVTYYE